MQKIKQKGLALSLSKGFTLLEVLLVIALIAILAGIVIVAINPAKQTADARDTQRRSDVDTILNAIYQYSIDNSGAMPAGIPTSSTCPGLGASEVCKTDGSCSGYVDLSVLTLGSKYVVAIPSDPQNPASSNGTGYAVVKTSDNRIIVCAPNSENTSNINISK
jgi:prepilin-type N-terminal cleavage/methylation domain-containing protein